MAGLLFLLVLFSGAIIFSFISVIVLYSRTKRLEENSDKLRTLVLKLLDKDAESAAREAVPKKQPFENMELAPAGTLPPGEPPPPPEAAPPYREPPSPALYETAPANVSLPAKAEKPEHGGVYQTLLSFIRGGNLWAAGGVVLLAVGFVTLIAYLGRRGFFTVEMGIAAAAAAGLAMILFGWRFRRKRPMYFIILQGGGLGILYLSVYAAYRFTPWFGAPFALVFMTLLIPPMVILAFFQNSQGLAALGFLGGFAAPLLLSTGQGNHLFLFSYYSVLDAALLAIEFLRGKKNALQSVPGGTPAASWKGLNLIAFFFTFGISLVWTISRYRREFFASSEPFFIVYIIAFTILGLRGLTRPGAAKGRVRNAAADGAAPEDRRFRHYSDITLVLGTPAAAALLQWKVFSFIEHGFALIAIAFSAFYLLLTAVILKRFPALRSCAEAYLALGTVLANTAIPLELSPGASGAVWAAEGAVLFFLAARTAAGRRNGTAGTEKRGDPRLKAAGLIVHAAAALAFIRNILTAARAEAPVWRSPGFAGSLIIAVSALAMAVMNEKLFRGNSEKAGTEKAGQSPLTWIIALWGFAWWFGGWLFEFVRCFRFPEDAFFIFVSASSVLCWALAAFLKLDFFLAGMVPAPLTAFFTVFAVFASRFGGYFLYKGGLVFTYNFFDPSRCRGWLAFLVSHCISVFLLRPSPPDTAAPENPPGKKAPAFEPPWFRDTRLFIVSVTGLAVLSASGRFYAMEAGLSESWVSLAGLLPLFAAVIVLPFLKGNRTWGKPLYPALPVLLSSVLTIWFLVSLFLPGNPAPLPFYIPVLNPLDLFEALCIVSVLFWQVREGKEKSFLPAKAIVVSGDIMVFFWIISVLTRSVHYFAGVRWNMVSASDVFQLCLFVFWALYGIFHIILGHRKKKRAPWIAGTVLVAVDIVKLILLDMRGIETIPRILSFFAAGLVLLFIGWAAPLPPPVTARAEGLKDFSQSGKFPPEEPKP